MLQLSDLLTKNNDELTLTCLNFHLLAQNFLNFHTNMTFNQDEIQAEIEKSKRSEHARSNFVKGFVTFPKI